MFEFGENECHGRSVGQSVSHLKVIILIFVVYFYGCFIGRRNPKTKIIIIKNERIGLDGAVVYLLKEQAVVTTKFL